MKHFIRIFYPNTPFADWEDIRLNKGDNFKIPEGAYGYCFFDKVEPKNRRSYFKNFSCMTYLGKAYDVNEILELFPKEEKIIKELDIRNLDKAVKTHAGWFVLRKGDRAIYEVS